MIVNSIVYRGVRACACVRARARVRVCSVLSVLKNQVFFGRPSSEVFSSLTYFSLLTHVVHIVQYLAVTSIHLPVTVFTCGDHLKSGSPGRYGLVYSISSL